MMSVLLPQVPWRRFVCVLRKLGYVPQKGKAGSGRPFFNPSRNPNVVTFREPHPGQNVGPTTLREYLRKLGVAPDEFVQLLRDC
jgi:predicted RNA binding protein YcfA (HicA-like mRNA interferase family)